MREWAASIVAFSLLLSSCGKKENTYRPVSQELRLNLYTEPPTIDPRKAVDTASIALINLCFEGLMGLDQEGKPTPAVAEKIEVSEDKKRYTFTLRDVTWSDGTPLTAYDFEKTWKTELDPSFACEVASELYFIMNAKEAKTQKCSMEDVGIKAQDAKTLQVDLIHPVPYFLSALATHTFFATPSHIIKAHPDWTLKRYVGNGPFRMKEWKHRDRIVLEKNPHYWAAQNTKLEKVTFVMVEDGMTELAMYQNGELDWAGSPLSNLPTEALSSLGKRDDLHQRNIGGTYYYAFNTKEFPFNNVNIRKAFALAINRQAIIANVTQTGQLPAMSLIPPTMWKLNSAYFQDNDTVEAKRLFELGLKELGVSADKLQPIRLSYNTAVGHHKIAQAIQEQWSQTFGISVRLENKEWKVFLDEMRLHQFQIARLGAIAQFNDPIALLDFYRYVSSGNNYSQWSDPKFCELLEAAENTIDTEKRLELLKEAEKVLMDEMPIAPIYFYTGTYLQKPYVKGVQFSEMCNLELKWAYVETNDPVLK